MTNVLELSQEAITKSHNAMLYDTLFRVDAIRNNLKKLIWDKIYQQTAMYKILEPQHIDQKELQRYGDAKVKPIQLDSESKGMIAISNGFGAPMDKWLSVPFIKIQSLQYRLGKEVKDFVVPFEKVIDDGIVKPMSESLDQMFFDFCRSAVLWTGQREKIKRTASAKEVVMSGCRMIDRNELISSKMACSKSFYNTIENKNKQDSVINGYNNPNFVVNENNGKKIVVSVKNKVFGDDVFFFTVDQQLGRCYLLPELMNCTLDMKDGIMEFGFDFEQALAFTNINGVSVVTLED